MCHPLTFISQEMIGNLPDRYSNGWQGAFHLYEQLGHFIFKGLGYGESSEGGGMSVEKLHDLLRCDYRDMGRPLAKFISVVRARALVDVVTRHENLFEQKWCFTYRGGYKPWDVLEDLCLLREDIDLFYVGSIRCKFASEGLPLFISL